MEAEEIVEMEGRSQIRIPREDLRLGFSLPSRCVTIRAGLSVGSFLSTSTKRYYGGDFRDQYFTAMGLVKDGEGDKW